jgi:hypothetical protein
MQLTYGPQPHFSLESLASVEGKSLTELSKMIVLFLDHIANLLIHSVVHPSCYLYLSNQQKFIQYFLSLVPILDLKNMSDI